MEATFLGVTFVFVLFFDCEIVDVFRVTGDADDDAERGVASRGVDSSYPLKRHHRPVMSH